MNRVVRSLRSIGSVVAGYALIVGLTTLVFKAFGGLGYHDSSAIKLLAGGACIGLAGACGGYLAAALAGRAPFAHGASVVLFLVLDTAIVFARGPKDPLWFFFLSAAGLMGGTVFGAALRWFVQRPGAPPGPHDNPIGGAASSPSPHRG